MSLATAFAPAKVNLFLHVGAPAADRFHPIASLMVFADVGDRLAWDPAGEGLRIEGAFAAGLASESDNLVLRARAALAGWARDAGREIAVPGGLVLEKALPIASGLGGGSSDAAAALRLLDEVWGLNVGEARLQAIAQTLGSDTPACVVARPALATGRGEMLSAPPRLPDLSAVLVNPGVASPTGPVYRAYDEAVCPAGANVPPSPEALASPLAVFDWLSSTRNDLQVPAVRIAPAIGACLAVLADQPQTRLARMSGSGATCFALVEGPVEAQALASRILAAYPAWWVRSCQLAGS
ncbi:MAG TPA: 4-(cytidine 5'-diphospho)-2-C-methyl-D-erythritol kinase [Caulobacteraceae bacterium]|jgi:4-diphosphocytidyl-2-C-methyl-D-erythritol kinase|nr:4-(cytidine 5'-diphospho)-2-C-methyl-D-erythritol kinase [Caulobacteraceae bacterium]